MDLADAVRPRSLLMGNDAPMPSPARIWPGAVGIVPARHRESLPIRKAGTDLQANTGPGLWVALILP